jgi:hypothetical protein
VDDNLLAAPRPRRARRNEVDGGILVFDNVGHMVGKYFDQFGRRKTDGVPSALHAL